MQQPQPDPATPSPALASAPEPAAQDEHEFDDIIELTRRSTGRDDSAVMVMFSRLRGPAQRLRDGDSAALRDHLVLLHAPLVEHCARNYVASGEPLEDLLQEGYVGLIKAVDRFDPFKGVRFSTYACHLITGEVRHYLRDLGKLIHEPGWHSELRSRISRTSDDLSQRLSRPAAPEEIAEALNVRPESVREVLRNTQVLAVDSLDSERAEGEESDEPRRPEIASPSRLTAPQVEERVILEGSLPHLKELEKRAIYGFFFEDKSKTQVAADLGISVNYVAYLIKQGTQRLRHIIEDNTRQIIKDNPLDAPLTFPEARALHLLSLVRRALWPQPPVDAKAGRERRRKTSVRESSGELKDFTGFLSILEDELRRLNEHTIKPEMCVMWLWASNWDALSARWSAEDRAAAAERLREVAHDAVRSKDHTVATPPSSLPDLHFVVALPDTGAASRIVEQRFLQNVPKCPGFAQARAVQWKSALVVWPHDGLYIDALFEKAAEILAATK